MTISTRARHDKLLALVAVFPLKVADLARMLNVSCRAIRSDIDYLSSRKKVHIEHDYNGMQVSAL